MSSYWQRAILSWYAEHGRTLPWRDTADPYRIWLSEIMLQQTRVNQGYEYYLRFTERFPTVEALAAASEDDVLQQWQGLGYYSRARNLHAAAKSIVAAGAFPNNYEDIRALKGVGDYTAAAVASIAFGLPYAVVDGNVYRVLARHFDIANSIDSTTGKRVFADLAHELLDRSQPGLYNQAMMDFGALQCTPTQPRCSDCPVADSCMALARGHIAMRPQKAKRTRVKNRYFALVYVKAGKKCYLRRRGAGDIWRGLYEPLLLEFDAPPTEKHVRQHPAVRAFISSITPHAWRKVRCGVKHQLTHRTLHTDFYLLTIDGDVPDHVADFSLIDEADRDNYAVPRLVEMLFELVNS